MYENNTRRHPRTLNEAFPGSPEYASSIEGPVECRFCGAAIRILAAIVVVIGFTVMLVAS